MEPKNLFYYHVFHWVEAAIVGQALLWLDPQDHPVHLVLPVDHLHVLPPLSQYLLCNLFGDVKREAFSTTQCNRNIPWCMVWDVEEDEIAMIALR